MIIKEFDHVGERLDRFLNRNDHEQKIKKKRGFYILSFNLDKKNPCLNHNAEREVVKIGIAQRDVYLRLRSYKTQFGKESKNYPNRGVYIHYLLITERNPLVLDTKSKVRKLEKYIIKRLGDQSVKTDRGKEWFVTDREKVRKALTSKEFDEEEEKLRQGLKPKTKKKPELKDGMKLKFKVKPGEKWGNFSNQTKHQVTLVGTVKDNGTKISWVNVPYGKAKKKDLFTGTREEKLTIAKTKELIKLYGITN